MNKKAMLLAGAILILAAGCEQKKETTPPLAPLPEKKPPETQPAPEKKVEPAKPPEPAAKPAKKPATESKKPAAPKKPAALVELPPGITVLDGKPAPELRLEDTGGRVINISQMRGRWLVVYFWTNWCAPCRRDLPEFLNAVKSAGPNGPRFVLVVSSGTEKDVAPILAASAPELRALIDRDGSVTKHWELQGVPASFFVDPEGRMRYTALGLKQWTTTPYQAFLRALGKAPIKAPTPG